MNVIMTSQITAMELPESGKIIANIHVRIVSVKKIRIVRLIYPIVLKDIAMLAYRIRIVRMEELALMGNAFAPKNLKEGVVKNVMILKSFVVQPSMIPNYIYKVTVM